MTSFEENYDPGHEGIKLPDHSQPSDYSDVMPSDYDPDYISQISSKMQVPHRIGVGPENSQSVPVNVNGSAGPMPQYNHAGMHVPDKIIIAGDNQHYGGRRQELYMDSPTPQMSTESLSYVGLMTPPRVLTLEERFPIVEDLDVTHKDVSDNAALHQGHHMGAAVPTHAGALVGPVAYEPGIDPRDPLLLNEESEASLLRTQVAKLTRRVQVIEADNSQRAKRELLVYPALLGYFLWKLLGWATRDHRW